MIRTALTALAAHVTLLGGFIATAHAEPHESWVYAGMRGGAMGWEASSVERNKTAGTASALRFFYFLTPEAGAKGDFSWAFQNIEFDCAANTFRLMDGALFNEARRGRSEQRGSDDVLPVQDGTPEYALKRILCDGAVLSGSLTASSQADAMDGAEALVKRQAGLGDQSRG